VEQEVTDYPKPDVMVDVALFTLVDGDLHILLAQRENPAEPFHGRFALPGGYIHVQEDDSAEASAERVLLNKAGVRAPYLEQLHTFTGPYRDRRNWSVSITYFALVPYDLLPADLPQNVRLSRVEGLGRLPFDHSDIVSKGLERLRGKAGYSSLPLFLLGDTFTLPEMQAVYEAVIGQPIERGHFRRRVLAQHLVDPIEGETVAGTPRPAQLYRRAGEPLVIFTQPLSMR
jgi:8-oxo-dGTP diphosphatase